MVELVDLVVVQELIVVVPQVEQVILLQYLLHKECQEETQVAHLGVVLAVAAE
tara:strand:- start:388 stop:546 length:159 start_codon:yes stop_codon:yes gene_type:complete